ncbi:MAG TPA: DUF6587 family protein [Burkholderiaceae bacterium]|jgi:hypothetical protein|nr:DUF6587 family protein [Burkholderiaceae bacterium]
MMQEAIVALIVLCATIVVLKRYAPKTVKQAVRSWATRAVTKLGWQALAAKIAKKAEDGASCGSGCGSCGACGSDSTNPAERQSTISAEALKQTIQR